MSGQASDVGPGELGPSSQAMRLRRVVLVGEGLAGRPDEGVTKFGLCLAGALRRRHAVEVIATRPGPGNPGVTTIPGPRTLFSPRLWGRLRAFRPDIIIYIPSASTTVWSFARAGVLKTCCPHATVVLVGLQPRTHSRLEALLVRSLAPELVYVQSESGRRYYEGMGCRVRTIPSGVDLGRFRPVPAEVRRQLRLAYGLNPDLPLVFHAGHLKAGRGVGILGDLARTGFCQALLLTSSSTAPDPELGASLRAAGVRVFNEFQPQVEHFYQLADCYVFPVQSAAHSVEMPLSVLEALACDLPVVLTRFGPLPAILPADHPAIRFADTAGELTAAALSVCNHGPRVPAGTRQFAAPFSWDAIAHQVIEHALCPH